MTLRRARDLAAHTAVALAFGSIAVGGDVPAPLIVAFFGLQAFGLFAGPRLGAWPRVATALTAAALLVLVGLFLGGMLDLVVAASLFASVIAANRLVARQGAADDPMLYLAALLMLAGGAALSAEVLYGLFFAGFTLSICVAMTLSHLLRVCEASGAPPAVERQLASRRLYGGLFALAAAGMVGAVVFFTVLPRFSAGLQLRVRSGREAVSGYSGELRLEGHGTVKSSPWPVLRVGVSPDPQVERLELRWRGQSFDRFDGRRWTRTSTSAFPTRLARLGPPERADARLDVQVLPAADTASVFVLGETATVHDPGRLEGPHRGVPQMLFLVPDSLGDLSVRPKPEAGFRYWMRSRLGPRGVDLRGRGAGYPDDVRALYLQLPAKVDPRVLALAREWTAGIEDPFDRAVAIERALSERYRYTTELPGEVDDPLAHFLLERRAGHCEYFSTSMAVLLRAVGVPTRNVVGFFGGARERAGEPFTVRAGDAHSWTEVYFPEVGFVAFDATPAVGRSDASSPWYARLAAAAEQAGTWWRSTVVDYTFWDQYRAVRGAARGISAGLERLRGRGGAGAGFVLRALAAGLLIAAAVRGARLLWQVPAPVKQRSKPPAAAREAVELYRTLLRRLRRSGMIRARGQTPRELAQQIARARPACAGVVIRVTERYLAARFGRIPIPPDELKQLRREVRRMDLRSSAQTGAAPTAKTG